MRSFLVSLLLLIAVPAHAAYYAQIDQNHTVLRVVVIDDVAEAGDETQGVDICQHLFGGGLWVKASIDGSLRKNYPGPGWVYYPMPDLFAPPQPFASWTLNATTGRWDAPAPYPDDGKVYKWNEVTQAWVTTP